MKKSNNVQQTFSIQDYFPCPFMGEGISCYEVNSRYWLSVMVDSTFPMASWVLYDNDFSLICRDYVADLSEETWNDMIDDNGEIGERVGHIEALIEIAPSVFSHLKNA